MSTDPKALYERIKRDAEESGYHLNPDIDFVMPLMEGLLVNEGRYGYQSCPCRLASGDKAGDLDMVCPCDYRDPDLTDYGACYCALYVSGEIAHGEKQASSIPERRPAGGVGPMHEHELEQLTLNGLPFPIWRCKVCGYLCARPQPPEVCPICKVKKERFERFAWDK
jgi:ferredoxin-thioredoxin reductase catalytic chain